MRVVEGGTERIQSFEGLCIRYRHRGFLTSCLLRKHSHGVDVEIQVFLYSPMIQDITVIRRGRVRRAVLYYVRGRIGKTARVEEKGMRARKRSIAEAKVHRHKQR